MYLPHQEDKRLGNQKIIGDWYTLLSLNATIAITSTLFIHIFV